MSATPEGSPDEFSGGLAYNLGRFLSQETHYRGLLIDTQVWAMEDRFLFPKAMRKDKRRMKEEIESMACGRWFNDAGHYLLNAQIPPSVPKKLQDRMKFLQKKMHRWMYSGVRFPLLRKLDVDWALIQAQEILKDIDEQHNSRASV